MKIIDLVAILGAMAWLPHLISFIKNYFTKPEVRIIAEKTPELGFTTAGPIFNVRVAFSVKNHDIVISNFKVKLKHESGEEKTFEWQGIKQQVLKMTTAQGSIPYEKENSVLAIKINQKEIEEKTIQCRETSFIIGMKNIEDTAIKKLSFDKEQENYDPIIFLKSQESNDVYNYIKQAFSWKSGRYNVTFHLESPENFTLIGNEYEFNLIPIDIEELEKNKANIEQSYMNLFLGEKHASFKEIFWKWRYPTLSSKNLTITSTRQKGRTT